MAKFVLTTRSNVPMGGGQSPIPQGEKIVVNINTFGVTPTNLFSNPASREALFRQLQNKGYDFGKVDVLFNRSGYFQVKEL